MKSHKQHVLIAEDNPDLRELYSFILAQAGFEVCAAPDGRKALRLLHEQHTDVLVTDIMMPRMNGLELVERVRGDDELKGLPIVVMSASAHFLSEAFMLGGTTALSKPADPADLYEAVLRALSTEAGH